MPHEPELQLRLGYLYAAPLACKFGENQPIPLSSLDSRSELQLLTNKLQKSKRRVHFQAEVATVASLRDLLCLGCEILHFTGHGQVQSEALAFEDEKPECCGLAHCIAVPLLQGLFQAAKVKTKLVLVSACSSQSAGAAFIAAGVPHVVAIRKAAQVTDAAALRFADSFYSAIFIGNNTVKNAFEIALETIRAGAEQHGLGEAESSKFTLLPTTAGYNHDVHPFGTEAALLRRGSYINETPPLPPLTNCPTPRELFLGRNLLLQKAVQLLASKRSRCITIMGERGIGKTEVAIRAVHYLRERRSFSSTTFVSCAALQPATQALSAAACRPEALEKALCGRLGALLGAPSQSHARDPAALLRLLRRRSSAAAATTTTTAATGAIAAGGGVSGTHNNANTAGTAARAPRSRSNSTSDMSSSYPPSTWVSPAGNGCSNSSSNGTSCSGSRNSGCVTDEHGWVTRRGGKSSSSQHQQQQCAAANGSSSSGTGCASSGDEDSSSSSSAARAAAYADATAAAAAVGGDSSLLLVLDGLDSECDSSRKRDAVVRVLDSLLRADAGLTVLMTQCQSLMGSSTARLNSEAEQMVVVGPLQKIDAANLLIKLSPRYWRRGQDLGLPEHATFEQGLQAMSEHPVLTAVAGHPGTLVRLAPELEQTYLGGLQQKALQYREEARQLRTDTASSSSNSTSSSNGAHREQHAVTAAAAAAANRISRSGSNGSLSSSQQQQAGAAGSGRGVAATAAELSVFEKGAIAAAQHAGLQTFCCQLMWVCAGWGGISSGSAWGASLTVEWSALHRALQQHFCGTLTAPYSGVPCIDSTGPNAPYVVSAVESGSGMPVFRSSQQQQQQQQHRPRPLSAQDFKFLKQQLQPEKQGELELVSVKQFKQFCESVWLPTLRTLGALGREWRCCNPSLLHGFLSREDTLALLQQHPAGTFLLRVNGKYTDSIVISFMAPANSSLTASISSSSSGSGSGSGRSSVSLQQVLARSEGGGRCSLTFTENKQQQQQQQHSAGSGSSAMGAATQALSYRKQEYSSLAELLSECPALTALVPPAADYSDSYPLIGSNGSANSSVGQALPQQPLVPIREVLARLRHL